MVLSLLLSGGQWPPAAAGVKSFKHPCLKYLNVHPALLISVLSNAFSLLSINRRRLPPPAIFRRCLWLTISIHHCPKLPTNFFLIVQHYKPLFFAGPQLSAAFRRRLPPSTTVRLRRPPQFSPATPGSGAPPKATANPVEIREKLLSTRRHTRWFFSPLLSACGSRAVFRWSDVLRATID